MGRGNLNGFEVSIERSCGPEKIGKDASTTSAPRMPQTLMRSFGTLACQMLRSPSTSVGSGMANWISSSKWSCRIVAGFAVDGGGT
jgi:hypothetical protein